MGAYNTNRPRGPAVWTRAGGWRSPTPASQLPIFHPGNPLHRVVISDAKPQEPVPPDAHGKAESDGQ